MIVYVLVKDYGHEGIGVYGATTKAKEALIWAASNYEADFIVTNTLEVPMENLQSKKKEVLS